MAWSDVTPKLKLISLLATMVGAYHGYSRKQTVGSAVTWALAMGIFWPVATPVMLWQISHKKRESKPIAGARRSRALRHGRRMRRRRAA